MAEYLISIALLCQIHTSGYSPSVISSEQRSCQQELAKCALKLGKSQDAILQCLILRDYAEDSYSKLQKWIKK